MYHCGASRRINRLFSASNRSWTDAAECNSGRVSLVHTTASRSSWGIVEEGTRSCAHAGRGQMVTRVPPLCESCVILTPRPSLSFVVIDLCLFCIRQCACGNKGNERKKGGGGRWVRDGWRVFTECIKACSPHR